MQQANVSHDAFGDFGHCFVRCPRSHRAVPGQFFRNSTGKLSVVSFLRIRRVGDGALVQHTLGASSLLGDKPIRVDEGSLITLIEPVKGLPALTTGRVIRRRGDCVKFVLTNRQGEPRKGNPTGVAPIGSLVAQDTI